MLLKHCLVHRIDRKRDQSFHLNYSASQAVTEAGQYNKIQHFWTQQYSFLLCKLKRWLGSEQKLPCRDWESPCRLPAGSRGHPGRRPRAFMSSPPEAGPAAWQIVQGLHAAVVSLEREGKGSSLPQIRKNLPKIKLWKCNHWLIIFVQFFAPVTPQWGLHRPPLTLPIPSLAFCLSIAAFTLQYTRFFTYLFVNVCLSTTFTTPIPILECKFIFSVLSC